MDLSSAEGAKNRKVSREDIELVQNLIERCLQLYMTKEEVVRTLLNRARIDPGFTSLVWQKLEEGNAEFFRAYYIRLKLKKQIILFNRLLEHQYQLMATTSPESFSAPPPAASVQKHKSCMPSETGDSAILKRSPLPAADQTLTGVASSSPVEIHFMQATSTSMGEIPDCSDPVTSGGHFPFSLDVAGAENLAMEETPFAYGGMDFRLHTNPSCPASAADSTAQIPWNFSLSDLSDLGSLENYAATCSSPHHLPADSDVAPHQGNAGLL